MNDTENGTEDEEEVAVNDTENGTEEVEEVAVNDTERELYGGRRRGAREQQPDVVF